VEARLRRDETALAADADAALTMRGIAAPTILACVAVLTPACGGGGAGGTDDATDKRGEALTCLTEEKDLPARAMGPDTIQVGDPRTGPRIQFFLTTGEAEAKQFEGGAEGSEQLGSALLFVRQGSERVLEEIEACLDEL
jgi:hypothetical protein